jgi:uncharacterized protein YecT (DUF1311 family)
MQTTQVHGAAVICVIMLLVACPARAQHVSADDGRCRAAGGEREIMACFGAAVGAADRKLNEVYGQIMRSLSADDQASLRSAERLWIQFRDATCKAEGDLYADADISSIAFESCVEVETQARSSDLLRIYAKRLEPAKPAAGKAGRVKP